MAPSRTRSTLRSRMHLSTTQRLSEILWFEESPTADFVIEVKRIPRSCLNPVPTPVTGELE